MFVKYPHIERLGKDEVEGITIGECYIFPKIDGTQGSVWVDEEGMEVHAASRRRELTTLNDNAGFYKWILESEEGERIIHFLQEHLDWTLYGEWLVPHSLKTYRQDAWRKFYVFDVYDRITECFVPYEDYATPLEYAQIDYIPVWEICENPTEEHLVKLLETNTYLIRDGEGPGEGLVIKRYDFENRFGRTTWAKLVRNEFKEKNRATFGSPKTDMAGELEAKIAETYITTGRVQKLLDKMTEERMWESKRIPELLGRIWHEFIEEEIWDVLKQYKNPTIDFRRLHASVVHTVKAVKPELF